MSTSTMLLLVIGQAVSEPLWVKIVPIIVSVTALVVAVSSATFTVYLQYFKRPLISVLINAEMDAWRTPDMHLVFSVPLVITNNGARYGIVHRITGVLTMPDGCVSPFQWRMFTQPKAVGDEGREFKPWGSFAGWAETLVVPSRSAVTKHVQFVSHLGVIVTPGT